MQTSEVTERLRRAPRLVPRHRSLGALVGIVVALTLVLRLPAFFVDVFNSDETFLATQGQVIRAGGALYRDAADRKPPLVPYVYAATQAVSGTTALWAVRVVAMLAVVATALLVAAEARRRHGRRAMWCAAVLTVTALVAFAPQDGQAANFEVFMLAPTVAAVMLARRGRPRSSGVAIACATLAKQTAVATLLPVAVLSWRRCGPRGLLGAALGFAAPILLVAAAMGPRQLLYWTVLGNGSYVGTRTASVAVVGLFVLMTLGWAACNVPILWSLPRSWRARRVVARDDDTDLDLWLWLVSAGFSVAIGLRFFGHYYLQLVPPLVLLTAGALARSSARAVRVTLAVAVVSGLMYSAAGYFMTPFGQTANYETVARYLDARSSPDDRVLVWGNLPEIYWSSGRQPATRYIATNSLVAANHAGRSHAARPDAVDPRIWRWFFRDLRAHPPRFIIDTSTSGIRGADRSPMRRYPRLLAYVMAGYRRDRTIDGLVLYVRR